MGRPKTGKIIARGENTWRLYWELGDDAETGKRRQKTETFHGTKEEARKFWRKRQAEIDAGKHPQRAKGMTVADLMTRWMADALPTRKLAPKTLEQYRDVTRLYIIPTLGDVTLERLTPLDLQKSLRSWMESPRRDGRPGTLSPTTVRTTYIVLRSALKQALLWELIDRNPADRVPIPPKAAYTPTVWDSEAVKSFLAVAEDHRWGAGFRLGLFCGLRRGEILGLQWGDINWEEGSVIIRRARIHVKGTGEVFNPTKRERQRIVVLDAVSLAWLERRREYAEAERRAAGELYHDHGLVIQTALGTPVATRNFNRSFDTLCQHAGVPKIRLHDLRHTHGTALHEAGVDLKTIQQRLGHSSIGITAKYYLHPGLGPQADAVDRLARQWENGPKNGPK
ncbi:tyrosine-type recombinase/integrase [Sulfobacillus harzensis]|uniref:Site-specific integrase n=1 Tax=Sulfobacillus harzensis TaxID=2729629 RepID=A0A7Y0Q4P0_9FIRM|nr:site-specific integrase [Sulfobacillus harzensis]NMP23434.1 site-specific integrase [Sulfobacillus harzensis]